MSYAERSAFWTVERMREAAVFSAVQDCRLWRTIKPRAGLTIGLGPSREGDLHIFREKIMVIFCRCWITNSFRMSFVICAEPTRNFGECPRFCKPVEMLFGKRLAGWLKFLVVAF